MKRILRKVLHRVFDFLLSIHQQERDKAYYQKFDIHPTVRFWNLSLEGNLSIGAHTYLNDNCRIDSGPASRVIIGRHCAIGRWVHITSKTHDLSCPTTSESQTEILHDEQDTVLGDYAIIGAHSLVLKDVEPFEIVGGIPAHHIRFNTQHKDFKK